MAGFFDSICNLLGRKNDPELSHENVKTHEILKDNSVIQNYPNKIQKTQQVSGTQRNTELDQSDDEYRSINVHGHSVYDPPIINAKNATSGMTWVGMGQLITVHGFKIRDPLTYWSNSNYPEASCIFTGLKTEKHETTILPPLPYWPQYSGLTPAQRGRYLSWLSRGRNDELNEIGYAFIFFYGLERRAIFDNTDHEVILDEVRRLLSRYSSSGSFNSYLNHFMAYVVGSRLTGMKDTNIRKFFPEFDNLEENQTKVVLSWHWSNRLPLRWDLCYSLAKNSDGFARTNITRKAPALLKQLFKKKFSEQFPQGIPISSESDQFQLSYRPASPSLLQYVGYPGRPGLIKPLSFPIPRLGSLPFETLRKIWVDCIDEIKPACNKLAKAEGKITRDVYNALPEALKGEIPHPELEAWRNFISAKPLVDGSLVLQVSDVALRIGIEKRDALTSSQSGMVTSTVRDFGWVLVPDQTTTGTSYKWSDNVAIVPIHGAAERLSENFQSAALIFELAYGIAASDENVSDIEKEYLHTFISEQFSLNSLEIQCLKGLQRVLEIQPPSLSRIGKRLSKHLVPEQKTTLANFLGEIVLLDDKFVKEEQKALKTVFKALEIDPAVSDELIKKLLVGHIPDEPVTVQKPGKARKGEAIPPPVVKPAFVIDKEKLRQTMDDTRAVQIILASVFEQEQEEIVVDIEPEVNVPEVSIKADSPQNDIDLPFPPETIPLLDVKYLLMLHDIMKSAELSQDEFTGLAKKHNLMPRAAFDDINTWADEELGDFLLEENESRIVINYQK
ncbi:TerB N-terminal domain-containing protein [Methanoregula sp.]|uniref:tellurite resistance TerB family protein n=1 Tax=Methanoregula sp. TaxID=2052170 RepID=UPI00356373A3